MARRRLGVALVFGDQREPARRRDLDDRGGAVLDEREAGADLAPEWVADRRARGLAAEREQQGLHRALAAVRERAEVGGLEAGGLDAAGQRGAYLAGAQGALEGVGGDEQAHGSGMLSQVLSFARV